MSESSKNPQIPMDGTTRDKAIYRPLTRRLKVLFLILFFIGLLTAYPPLMPISIACASILLLQKRNKKVCLLGLFIIVMEIVVLSIYFDLVLMVAWMS